MQLQKTNCADSSTLDIPAQFSRVTDGRHFGAMTAQFFLTYKTRSMRSRMHRANGGVRLVLTVQKIYRR